MRMKANSQKVNFKWYLECVAADDSQHDFEIFGGDCKETVWRLRWGEETHEAFTLKACKVSLSKRVIDPLMPKRYFCTSSFFFLVFKKQMLQATNTDLFNPLVPKAHNSKCQKYTIAFTN